MKVLQKRNLIYSLIFIVLLLMIPICIFLYKKTKVPVIPKDTIPSERNLGEIQEKEIITVKVLAGTAVVLEGECIYRPSKVDSKESFEVIAEGKIKRLLFDKMGTILEDRQKAKNFGITGDQIAVSLAGMLKVEVMDKHYSEKEGYLRIRAGGDADTIIDNVRLDPLSNKDLDELVKSEEDALQKIERLRKELSLSSQAVDIQKLEEFKKYMQVLEMVRSYEKGKVWELYGIEQYARDAYSYSISLNPRFAYAYYSRAIVSQGYSHGDVIGDLTKAIELEPTNALFYYQRGYSQQHNNVVQAIEDFNKAIDLNPQYDRAYSERGNVYFGLSDYSKAIRDFDKAIEIAPQSRSIYNNRGVAYSKSGIYRRAINNFDKAIELGAQNANYNATFYYNRGTAYDELGEYKQAISDFDKAIELNPPFREAGLHRLKAYEKLGVKPSDIPEPPVAEPSSPSSSMLKDAEEEAGSSHVISRQPPIWDDSDEAGRNANSSADSAMERAEKSDAELPNMLVGRWIGSARMHHNTKNKDIEFTINNILYSDGRFESITLVSDGKTLRYSGKWHVSDGNLVWETLSTNQPSSRVPNTETNRIIDMNEHMLVLQEKGFQSKWVKE